MFRLHYAGDSVLVASDVGAALMRYARALADARMADVVSVPIVSDDGDVVKAEFLLGPSSQLFSTPLAHLAEAGNDRDVVEDLDRRGRSLRPSADFSRPLHDAMDYFDLDAP